MSEIWLSKGETTSLLGPERSAKLHEQFGGVRKYVPKIPNPKHPFAQCIGLPGLLILIQNYGGFEVTFAASKPTKKQQIIELSEKGLSAREISERVQCAERYVRNVRSRM